MYRSSGIIILNRELSKAIASLHMDGSCLKHADLPFSCTAATQSSGTLFCARNLVNTLELRLRAASSPPPSAHLGDFPTPRLVSVKSTTNSAETTCFHNSVGRGETLVYSAIDVPLLLRLAPRPHREARIACMQSSMRQPSMRQHQTMQATGTGSKCPVAQLPPEL